MTDHPLRILSLGAGVQSSTLLMMSCKEAIERYDFAIFADTGWEPAEVYRWLGWLEANSSIPIIRVTSGINIFTDLMRYQKSEGNAGTWFSLPFHLRCPETGADGLGRRQCTERLKIRPINYWLREHLGCPGRKRVPAGAVDISLGFSTDEARRAKPSTRKWQRFNFPLLDLGMSRTDCLQWVSKHYGLTPPKSACIGCPFRSPMEWLGIRENADEWEQAQAFDHAIRRHRLMDKSQYLHRKRIPLAEAVESSLKEGTVSAVRSGPDPARIGGSLIRVEVPIE